MPDKKAVSQKELADMANVSTATISRVLNNNGRFSEATRERVMNLIRQTGYAPNVAAKALRTRTARAIGLVIPDVVNEFFSRIVDALGRVCFERDYSLFVCNADEDPEKNRLMLNNLLGKGVDGLIYISRFPLGMEDIGVPVVCLDRVSMGDEERPSVMSDNRQGGRLAAEALLRAGSRRLIMLCDPDDPGVLSTIGGRIAGFEEALAANGTAWSREEGILPTSLVPGRAREAVARAVREGLRFDGVFSTQDIGGIGAILGLEDVGLRVPEDVNVVGFDGIGAGEFCRPSLTTVSQDVRSLAMVGAGMLLDVMERRQPESRHVVIPVELVERDSTRR